MGQRINIQYTVDVDDLPREVGRLLEKAFDDYQMLQVECRRDNTLTTLSYDMVEKIERIRITLATIDHLLNDSSNIISGYLGYKAQQEAPAALPPPVDGLEEKLNKFKEMLETTENEVSD